MSEEKTDIVRKVTQDELQGQRTAIGSVNGTCVKIVLDTYYDRFQKKNWEVMAQTSDNEKEFECFINEFGANEYFEFLIDKHDLDEVNPE